MTADDENSVYVGNLLFNASQDSIWSVFDLASPICASCFSTGPKTNKAPLYDSFLLSFHGVFHVVGSMELFFHPLIYKFVFIWQIVIYILVYRNIRFLNVIWYKESENVPGTCCCEGLNLAENPYFSVSITWKYLYFLKHLREP